MLLHRTDYLLLTSALGRLTAAQLLTRIDRKVTEPTLMKDQRNARRERNARRAATSLRLNGTKIRNYREQRHSSVAEFAEMCDCSERTISRAERSENISFETARAIASVLEVTVTDLMDDRTDNFIEQTIDTWFKEGHKSLPNDSTMPLHPEYVYRLTRDWRGWIHFLDISPDSQEYQIHQRIDEMENRAFRILDIIFEYQMRKLSEKVDDGHVSKEHGVEIVTCTPWVFE